MHLNQTKLFLLYPAEFLCEGIPAGHLKFPGGDAPTAAGHWCFLMCSFGVCVILWDLKYNHPEEVTNVGHPWYLALKLPLLTSVPLVHWHSGL